MDVSLILFRKDGTQKVFQLSNDVTVIGRRPDCHLRVPVKLVSRRHCQLSHREGELKIRDLGSLNGTFLNGKRVDEASIQAGDRIKVGSITLTLQVDGKHERRQVSDTAKPEITSRDAAPGGSTGGNPYKGSIQDGSD